jgi:Flp pilus assembly protein TadD
MDDDDAHAIVAEVMTRLPEHREEGLKQLQTLAAEPASNQIAHRSLAYFYIQNKDFKQASSEISEALDEGASDPWARYYEAVLRFRVAAADNKPLEGGLATVQQDLRGVVDWNPQFAEAQHMLALAELQGGGTRAALDTTRTAIQLAPRNRWYLLNLADIYIAGKKWDDATTLLEQLKSGSDPKIASAARKKLDDLPFVKKYGIQPDESAPAQQPREIEANSGISNPLPDEPAAANPQLKERPPDKRPIKYVKGRIVSVDCSKAPEATVTVFSGVRTLKLHTSDYKSVALVGADQFSCT